MFRELLRIVNTILDLVRPRGGRKVKILDARGDLTKPKEGDSRKDSRGPKGIN